MRRGEFDSGPVRRAATQKRRGTIVWFLLLSSFVLQAAAQEAQPDTYAGFEGDKVAKVDISAKPTFDVEAFRSLIQQKPGQPFSVKAIRDSVEALQKTGLFSKVQVSIKPEQDGLNILFILEPASYIGILKFPGATKTFTYTQLLQAVNIPEQTAYVNELPTQGTQALLQFFRTNGYFEASVTPNVERDDAHRIVNLRFDCRLNRLARFGELNIQGLSDEETSQLRDSLRSFWASVRGASLKPGKKYSPQRINTLVSYIRTHFRKEGRLAPQVQFNSPTYRAESGRADLNLQVDAGPFLSVRVVGAHMFKRTLQRLIPIYEENSIDQDLVDEGRRNLLSYFESKGYFDATVNSHMDRQQNSVSIVYDVNRGAKHQVEELNFQGNHHFEDKQLQAIVPVKKGRSVFGHFFSRGTFSQELIRKSLNAITAAYRDAGFSDVVVSPNVADYEPRVDITFQISEGEQYKVSSLKLEDKTQQGSAQAIVGNHELNLAPGKPYSPTLLQQDRNYILAQYLDRGYLNAKFHSDVNFESTNRHLVDIVYTIDRSEEH